jgi:MFS family permease
VTRVEPIDDAARTREAPRRGALSYPRYRRYWLASVAMVFAVQFHFIGSGWLVHRLTDSAFWLGVPGIISAVVTILLTVPAGALADRLDNRRVLVVSRGLTGITHLALAVLVVTGVVELWMVLVWAAVAGALGGLSSPAQSAMLPRLIDRSAMASAVALISSVWSGMRIIGPALAGLLIAVVGIGQAFFVTAVGYAVSTLLVASLRLERLRPGDREEAEGGMFAGVRYVFAHRIFLATIGLSFFGRSYVVLLPIFSDDILRAGVQGFGYMEAAAGAGALIGTLSIVRVRIGRHTGAMMTGSALVFGLSIASFAVSRSLALSMLLLFVGAFFSSIYLNLAMTTLQLLVPDALRGRVMGVWGLTWFLTSAGGFVAASIAEFMGAPFAVALGALSVSGFAVFVYVAFAELRAIPAPDEGTDP